jgi:ADP-ribosylglycohydrolase
VITVCTHACITGGIAHAFYGPLPEHITRRVYSILDDRLGEVTREFMHAYVEATSN